MITEYKVIPTGAEGNERGSKPVIAFWYQITDLTDEDVSPMNWVYVFTAYQDNDPNTYNEMNVAALPDDQFLDSQMERILTGLVDTINHALDDAASPRRREQSSVWTWPQRHRGRRHRPDPPARAPSPFDLTAH